MVVVVSMGKEMDMNPMTRTRMMTTKGQKSLVAATTALLLAALAMSPATTRAGTPSASESGCGNVTWTASVDLPGPEGYRSEVAAASLPRVEAGQALLEPKATSIAIIIKKCCVINNRTYVCGKRCDTAGW
jgi:hypothetical protein